MSGYPIVLRLEGRNCLIVGGGAAAESKAAGLLESGADRLLVISPIVTPRLAEWREQGRLQVKLRTYEAGDASGMFLVISATGILNVDQQVRTEAESFGALFSSASRGLEGDFAAAAAVRRGELLLAVTTGGGSPAMAALIRRELEERYGPPYGDALLHLAESRRKLLVEEHDVRARRDLLRLEAERLAAWAALESHPIDEVDGKDERRGNS